MSKRESDQISCQTKDNKILMCYSKQVYKHDLTLETTVGKISYLSTLQLLIILDCAYWFRL